MGNACKYFAIGTSVLVAIVLASVMLANSFLLFDRSSSSDFAFADGFGSTSGSPSGRFEFHLDANGNDLGGTSVLSSATAIKWRSEFYTNSKGASVLEVVKAAADRIQQLQRTPQASDTNARALWELRKAIDIMEGKEITPVSPLGDAL
jgi:hypothetical protein